MAVTHTEEREYDVERELGDDRSIAEAVLYALEDAGVDHTRGETTLNDAVDPDALNRLFERRRSGNSLLAVELWGRVVVVDDDAVRVYGAEERSEAR